MKRATIVIPQDTNKMPTEDDYKKLSFDVVSALNDFHRHDGVMKMFIENNMDSIITVYCYLLNKIETRKYVPHINLTTNEQAIYSKLIDLKDHDIYLDNFLTRVSMPIATSSRPRPF